MSKKVIKPIVLIVVFIAALITFCITTNKGNKDMTTKQADATLPVMSFNLDKIKINTLHGYTTEMDPTKMRDCVIPISDDRKLSLSISTYGIAVDRISYKIRSMDGKRLVADDEISSFSNKDNTIQADISMPNVMDENTEYLLVFTITSGQDNVYYYSRIMQTDGKAAAKVVEFAKKFHDETFIKDDKSFFTTYMETTTGDRNTLAHVDLTSTVSQITWGSMAAAQYTNPVIALKEINDSYDVVTIDYVMSCVDGKSETEYYNVREYFRLRQTESRMYVLNYERTANQIFNSENSFISDSGSVMLGIRSSEAEYRANEAGSVICFVQEGDLYSYDINNGMIIKVFSFRDAEGIDERENWNHHDIKIVSVDEAGSIDFVVYGYMNRGTHEGEVGTGVYHYDGLAHTIDEEAFIPSKTSYEVLKAEMGKMLYLNEKNEFYLMMDDSLYRINLGSMSVKKVVEGLSTGSYCASESNRYFAWVDSANQYSSNTIKVMDLKSGKTFEVKKGDDQYLRPLGFIGEDFIYGQANAADVVSDAAGNTTFPMNGLIILDTSDQSELKTYTPSGGYVEKISVDGYTVTIDLIAQNNGVYAEIGQDTIMNREADSKQKIALDTSQSDTKLTVSAISIAGGKKPDKLKQLTAQMTINSHDTTVDLKFDDNTVHFYVYAKGDVIFASDNISDAIKQANDSMGVVIDSNQQYVWMRARKNAVNAFANIACNETDKDADSVVKSVSAMLTYNDVTVSVSELIGAGSSAVDVLKNNLPDKEILDLQGVSSEDIIFYISQGNPVFAMTGNTSAVLVTGYSSNGALYIYNPDNGATTSMSYEDADRMFYNGGLHFITYMTK
ncbi:hypothetical protein [Agathobacter rectalis]|uniref:hypothetical protein n=1 Tax=Agathobacter rectalis TaxID=39491 RepID=UPI00356980E1